MKLPAKAAVMVATQVARGWSLLKESPTSFLTARAARRKWQRLNREGQVVGKDCSLWESSMVSMFMVDTVMVSVHCDMRVEVLSGYEHSAMGIVNITPRYYTCQLSTRELQFTGQHSHMY